MTVAMKRIFALLVVVLIATSTDQPSHAQLQPGGEISYPETSSISNFDPYDNATWRSAEDHIFALIYEGLVKFNFDTQEVEPLLAQRWEPNDLSLTSKVRVFLREGVRWHDGEPFTARDVEFTIKYAKSMANPTRANFFNNLIRSVRVIDIHELEIEFTRSLSNPLQNLGMLHMHPKHCFDMNGMRISSCNTAKNPIGTGPYKFVERTLDANVLLAVNNDYWRDRANIDKVRMAYEIQRSNIKYKAVGGQYQVIVDTPPADIAFIENSQEFQARTLSCICFLFDCSQ